MEDRALVGKFSQILLKTSMVTGLGFLTLTFSHALNLQHIPISQLKQIRMKFAMANHLSTDDDRQKVISRQWNCDLYGARTQMQIEKHVALYLFNSSPNHLHPTKDGIHNLGSHLIKNYFWSIHGLQGSDNSLVDILRFSSDHQELIGEMSIAAPPGDDTKVQHAQSLVLPSVALPTRTVIAYAVCR